MSSELREDAELNRRPTFVRGIRRRCHRSRADRSIIPDRKVPILHHGRGACQRVSELNDAKTSRAFQAKVAQRVGETQDHVLRPDTINALVGMRPRQPGSGSPALDFIATAVLRDVSCSALGHPARLTGSREIISLAVRSRMKRSGWASRRATSDRVVVLSKLRKRSEVYREGIKKSAVNPATAGKAYSARSRAEGLRSVPRAGPVISTVTGDTKVRPHERPTSCLRPAVLLAARRGSHTGRKQIMGRSAPCREERPGRS